MKRPGLRDANKDGNKQEVTEETREKGTDYEWK